MFFKTNKQKLPWQNNRFHTNKRTTSPEPESPPAGHMQGGTDSQRELRVAVQTPVIEELARSHEQLGESSYCQSLSALADLKRVS